MAPKSGDKVRVHYRGTLSDGTEFDCSEGREPIEFEVGAGQVIPGFDEAVSGMEVGDKTTVTIPAAEAYGDRMEEAVQEIPLAAFGDQVPEEGWAVELQAPDGSQLAATILSVDDENGVATLDFNHPLAGQDLTFELELTEIVDDGPKLIIP